MPRKTRFWERDGRRLPGKLADETTGPDPAESARLGALYTQRQQAVRPRAEAGRWVPRHDGTELSPIVNLNAPLPMIPWPCQIEDLNDGPLMPLPQATADLHAGYSRRTPDIQATADDLAQWSAYLDRRGTSTGRPALHGLNGCRRIEELYLAVCQQLRETTADRDRLDEANGRLIARIRGLEQTVRAYAGHTCDTAVMPRVRSLPAPGPAGDDGGLLVPWGHA